MQTTSSKWPCTRRSLGRSARGALRLALFALAASGCAGLGFPPEPAEAPLTRCDNPQGRYAISYPSSWHTNPGGGPVEPCRFFHPEPFSVEPFTEEPSLAISVKREDVPFERFLEGGSYGQHILQRERLTVAGHPAVRLELLATEDAPLYEPGTREYLYAIRAGPDSFLRASTLEVPGLDYARNKQVLDRMVLTLQLP